MPILDIGNTKQLEFGYGDIEVAPGLLELEETIGVVCFIQTERKPIGVHTDYDEPIKLPMEETPVRMTFEKTESIDVLIWALQEAKRKMIAKSLR
ncbi:hypothetical protein [Mesobacillus stamsii]|uniref:Uncharacterized protein n=1 Tax=Mesobacillus stamsii TaxID=225347 RepID=A0ABU0FS06_9BACI|nr:hypothetical protein [Mesobacillus stamsii]MDQ0412700.1 hypothetical protein [Mesobacillus stamsii]